MRWNWQRTDWPSFSWNEDRLKQAEQLFLIGGGVVLGAVRHLDDASQERVIVDALSEEALTTSAIEGEVLDRDSVQSSVRRALGLQTDARRSSPAERGIAELMVSLYRTSAAPLDDATLFEWHTLLLRGRQDVREVGRYRTHDEPMQIVSGRVHAPTVHFEAPPSSRVPPEMRNFIDWFNDSAPSGSTSLPALTRAGVAHLYFESIHPFEDGNGRIGRAISEKALAQGLGGPTLTAIAATLLFHRKSYYRELEASNKRNEITDWLAWFAGMALEAQQRTRASVEFVIDKAKLLDRLRGRLNDRQEKVLLRVLAEGTDGFEGGLSAGNYVSIAKTSPATARRDLGELVELGALSRTGERRHARYRLTIPLRPTPGVAIDADGNVVAADGDARRG